VSERRVVVTGLGIVSSIGSTLTDVLASLTDRTSGLRYCPELAELGFACHVYAPVQGWHPERLPKRTLQATSAVGQYALSAAMAAIADAGLATSELQNDRTAVIIGSAFGGLDEANRVDQLLRTRKSPSRAGGTSVLKMLNSSAAGTVATSIGAQGRAYSLASAFATGADCIGHAYDLIRLGLQDIALCGGSEESVWHYLETTFAAFGTVPTAFNDRPQAASRPFDRDRQGVIFSEGAGVLLLEPLERARARGARVYGEIVGYGSANDGADMFRPTGEGLAAAIRQALDGARAQGVERIDYVNPHATGTPLGDAAEMAVLRECLPERPWVSGTKGQTGHALGAAGAQEAILTLLMLEHNFLAPTFNLENLDPACEGLNHVFEVRQEALNSALTISIGLGGCNAGIVVRKVEGDEQ